MAGTTHEGHRKRMYEKFDNMPFDKIPEHEVLEILLYYVMPRKNTNFIAHDLIDRFGSLRGVLTAPRESLESVENIGEAASRYLNILGNAFKRFNTSNSQRSRINAASAEGKKFLLNLFRDKTHEEVYMLCLDARDNIILHKQISTGGFMDVVFDAGKILKTAIMADSPQIVLAHNHPSGQLVPSQEDIRVTEMLAMPLSAAGIRLRDHIIVTNEDCASMIGYCNIGGSPRRNKKK